MNAQNQESILEFCILRICCFAHLKKAKQNSSLPGLEKIFPGLWMETLDSKVLEISIYKLAIVKKRALAL